MDNDTIKDLGLCPICQKGHIMKGSLGYSCNYFKNMNDKCTFNIYHSYWGKEITEEIARQLITTGKTDIFHDFHNKKGVPFSAYLTIENGIVIPSFVNEVLAYIIHSGFISGYQNRYGDNLKPPTNVYHRMTA